MLARNLETILSAIQDFEKKYHRDIGTTKLIAVSKGQPIEKIQAIFAAGQRDFAENYLQEALPKMEQLKALSINWHFIGAIQANKTKLIAENFSWVHSVSREKIAQRLQEQRPKNLPPLNICIEVNVSDESQKSGAKIHEVEALAKIIQNFDRLALRGLMTIIEDTTDFNQQCRQFKKLAELKNDLNAKGFSLDQLSMGMSQDYEAAISAGATMIRIGTALFGERQ